MRFQPRTLVSILLLLMAIGIAQMLMFQPRMPTTMASSFGAGGQAQKWTARQTFFTTMGVLHVGVTLLLWGTAYLMKIIPMRMMNIPKKDYWADPEHEDEARDFLYTYMLWFACATVALLNAIVYLTCRANLNPGQGMGPWAWVVAGAYLVWTIAWTVRMILKFYRIPKEDDEDDDRWSRGRGGDGGTAGRRD